MRICIKKDVAAAAAFGSSYSVSGNYFKEMIQHISKGINNMMFITTLFLNRELNW